MSECERWKGEQGGEAHPAFRVSNHETGQALEVEKGVR